MRITDDSYEISRPIFLEKNKTKQKQQQQQKNNNTKTKELLSDNFE